MSVIRTCMSLFGGDTVIVRCSNSFDLEMINGSHTTGSQNKTATQDAISVSAKGEVYLTVPYTGDWDLIIHAKNDTPEHSISYFPA
ncbi:hypothetical protein JMY81_01470 [Brenneria goodwinii]|uniref:hypothetical protein n=1 Tax=Brenneria goodwinii TaxID=1109412 RepID=UPI00090810ED|nr:hypothetical protein [Brenneria goodwinii]MCG8155265.1 hypothetical protein [Brenneria goodwinii]MCG8159509.1 hypothetical protein [Brenneria goodwinii]MCG8164322.1 hypothetical protein [Brenneria goodwinii]MCG8169112.1 hypothetical protein [Brenneria goodwinii]MCG8173368.1 hypothetical protein [Brenneria goodwinii]